MKEIFWLTFTFFSFNADSKLILLKEAASKSVVIQKKKVKKANPKLEGLFKNLETSEKNLSKSIESLAKKKDETLTGPENLTLPMLTTLSAVAATALISTNKREAPFEVVISDSSPLAGAKLRCSGRASLKRVEAVCDRLVHNGQETKITAAIYGTDHALGVFPDRYYSSAASDFAISSFSTFMAAVLEGSKSKQVTNFGQVDEASGSNALKSGLSSVATNFNESIANSNTPLEVAIIYAGKKLKVKFLEGVEL